MENKNKEESDVNIPINFMSLLLDYYGEGESQNACELYSCNIFYSKFLFFLP